MLPRAIGARALEQLDAGASEPMPAAQEFPAALTVPEVLVHILLFLDPDERVSLASLVCKEWRDAVQDVTLWKELLDEQVRRGAWPPPGQGQADAPSLLGASPSRAGCRARLARSAPAGRARAAAATAAGCRRWSGWRGTTQRGGS